MPYLIRGRRLLLPLYLGVILLLLVGTASATSQVGPNVFFPRDKRLNAPIPLNPEIDPASPIMAAGLAQVIQQIGSIPIDVKQWSVPIYLATGAEPRQDVQFTQADENGRKMRSVPIPANAAPDPMGDGHMAIINQTNQCAYEFFRARKVSGSWYADTGNNVFQLIGNGVYTDGGPRASGFSLLAGLIRPEEINAGVINHALAASYSNVKAGYPVYPARQSDGTQTNAAALPMGARIQLNPSFDVNTLTVPWQRVVARAMQVYGMYIVDTGGNFGFWAQNPQSYPSNPYPWGDVNHAFMPTSLAPYLRVLKLPPQQAPPPGRTPHCATIS